MIVFSHYCGANELSGVTTWLEHLVVRLHKDGLPVAVYLKLRSGTADASGFVTRLQSNGVPLHIDPRRQYSEDEVSDTLRFVASRKVALFLPQCLESHYYAAGIAGAAGIPWIFTIHSDDPVYWAIAEQVKPSSCGGRTIAVSSEIARSAEERGLARGPQVIQYGTALRSAKAKYSNRPFRVAFSGRVVEEQKRFSLVLSAMILACQADGRVECVVFGDGPSRRNAEALVAAKGLSNRIIFRGAVDRGVLLACLAECQAIVLMSDYEGLPLALLEAMSCGLVPVVRGIPSGIPELIEQDVTGVLVDDSPESAASAIVELVQDESRWERLSTAARHKIAADFSEEVCYQQWKALIEKLAAREPIVPKNLVPWRLRLPPPHPALARRDLRKPSSVRTLAGKVIRRLRRCFGRTIA